VIGGVSVRLADFSHVPVHCKFIALMPHGTFSIPGDACETLSQFHLLMEAESSALTRKSHQRCSRQHPQGSYD